MKPNLVLLKTLLIGLGCSASAQTSQDAPFIAAGEVADYSPYPDQNFPNQVFFGDTHLHTAYSADAGLALATKTPDEAYAFAKGETVVSSLGVPARLQRPLDWLVVADHAENLGLPIALETNDPVMQENEWGRELAELYAPKTIESARATYAAWFTPVLTPGAPDPMGETNLVSSYWQKYTEAAERHNLPGTFTALIGFEWTTAPDGNNLHRNVIFRDGKDLADTIVPLSAFDTNDVEDLWEWMQVYEDDTGGRLLAIPHNGNLSNGLMFDDVTLSGEPLSVDYAERRQRWEPIYEVTQMKGDGETHPMLSPDDAFADFATWDKGSFGPELKTPEMLPREYAREALKRGLAYEDGIGANPFKFGMIGSTDSHTGLSTAQENNFFGKVSALEPTNDPIRYEEPITGGLTPDDPADDIVAGQTMAAGIAAVWARENTREDVWDALKRKEVYATTGTRIRVRVFAGYDFEEADLPRSDFAAHGYENGVPMGGDLMSSEGSAPNFLIRALRDPDGANLDRVQVVKGWLNADGSTSERVYDVACGGRDLLADGCDGLVGNTVDPQTATWTNDIGEPILAAYWQDPEFDPAQKAFYYVRVLEIPTPRWTTYDSVVFGFDLPEGTPTDLQERAYTSPIWYTPS
ncbi:DUF3604 domain-containing protein [Ruegeria arenilitoris]|uniref:DUF3604 domain-containing protein n=1 Tax=Ruegeria arenilitoris TaxID=1173585 RepID=UPI00147A865E|nr:DUF3604 domain-containing protein [Ruegeria arenilitoris]